MKNVIALMKPYLRNMAQSDVPDQVQLKRLLCVTVKLTQFEELIDRFELDRVILAMNNFYSLIVEAAEQSDGSIDRFSGQSIVLLYGAFRQIDTVSSVSSVKIAFRKALDSLRVANNLDFKIGMCLGDVAYGRFGSSKRATVTGFGPPMQCANHLAQKGGFFNVCELLAPELGGAIESDPLSVVHSHWRPNF